MRQLLFIIILLFISNQVKSQLSGYQGKRFLVKADLVDLALNDGFGFSGEFAFARRMSLSFNANKRSLFFEDLTNPPTYWDNDDEDEMIVNSKSYGLGIRWYKSQAFTAPKGVYSYINVNVGKADVELDYIRFNYGNNNSSRSSRVKDLIEDLEYVGLELGIGNQTIIANRIVLDIGIGYNTAAFVGDYEGEIIYNSNARIDRNLWGFEIGEDAYFGFSGHLSVGLLLF